MKKSPVSMSSNCCASRMLNPPSNSAAETFATIPGRLTHERVRMWRVLDTRAPYDDFAADGGAGYRFTCFSSASTDGRIFWTMISTPAGVRVQPVGLIELRIARDAVEEERVKLNAIGFHQSRIDRREFAAVIGPEVGSGPHAGEKRRQMSGSSLVQNRRQRRLRRRGRLTAQHVVGAELDDERVGVLRHRPVVAREAVRGRIAGDAGVDHLDVPALGAKRRFEAVGKSLARRQAVSSRQAVAQGHEAKRPRRGGVRGSSPGPPRRPPPGRGGANAHMRATWS